MLSHRFRALMQNCGHMKMYEKLHLILRSMLSKKVTTKSTSPTHRHTILITVDVEGRVSQE